MLIIYNAAGRVVLLCCSVERPIASVLAEMMVRCACRIVIPRREQEAVLLGVPLCVLLPLNHTLLLLWVSFLQPLLAACSALEGAALLV